jgi:dipeptidase D
VVSGPTGLAASLDKAAELVTREAQQELSEPDMAIRIQDKLGDGPPCTLSAADSARLLRTLAALPHGVLGMNPNVPGLVQASNNLATISITPRLDASQIHVEIATLSRSPSASWLGAICEQIASVGRLGGATARTANEYPGWEPNPDSPVLAVCRRVYERLFREPPKIAAIHAGLECGVIGERVGGMDMVSLGPEIKGAHSPDERVYVDSVAKSWKLVTAVLADLAQR